MRNIKITTILLISLVLLLLAAEFAYAHGDQPYVSTSVFFYESFDGKKSDSKRAVNDLENQLKIITIYQPSYSKGIKGKALDLSSDAPMRTPMVLEKDNDLKYTKEQSFSLIVWVKTKKGARQGLPIWTNKKYGTKDSVGWCLGTQDNGAWLWNMSDGNVTYNYEPTTERQAINDGNWHQLAVSLDRSKREVWMYMDGENVAVYQIEDANLQSMESSFRTIVGGADDYYDFGSNGEWTAFNGLIDEVSMYDRPLTASEVRVGYERLTGKQVKRAELIPDRLKIQVWNIWHGGHRFGHHVGVERTCEILKQNNADIIGLVETYGSGAVIADSLGYYFYLISTNLSIMSRYPIEETISVYQPFNSGGAIINLGDNQRIAFFDIWLSSRGDKYREPEIKEILPEIDQYLRNAERVPVIMVGDFNSPSHLDLTEETVMHYGGEMRDRPISKLVTGADLIDSYRVNHPNPAMSPGYTWSPLRNEIFVLKSGAHLSRIDYIYYKGKKLQPYHSYVIDSHPVFFPSDHASVITSFYLDWD